MQPSPPISELPVKRSGIFSCLFVSLLCVFAGWCVLVAVVHGYYYFNHLSVVARNKAYFDRLGIADWQPVSRWWTMPSAIAIFSVPVVSTAWLLFVLPLFIAVRPGRLIWNWPVTVLGFGVLSGLGMYAGIRWQIFPQGWPFVWFAAATGASTGLFCAIAKRQRK